MKHVLIVWVSLACLVMEYLINHCLLRRMKNKILWVHTLMICATHACGWKYQECFAGWGALLVIQSNDDDVLYAPYILPLFSVLCQAWIQFFYTATWFWTLCYAVDVRRVLKSQGECTICYHIIAWLSPAILTSVGLLILYLPHAQ